MTKSHYIKSKFTLMELLIVISIIAILFSMMFPYFKRAKYNAKNTACLSNLNQIAKGSILISMDNGGSFPERAKGDKPTHLANGSRRRDYIKYQEYINFQSHSCPLSTGILDLKSSAAAASIYVESQYMLWWGINNFSNGDKSFKTMKKGYFNYGGEKINVLAMDYLADRNDGGYSENSHDGGGQIPGVYSNKWGYYIRRYEGKRSTIQNINYAFTDGAAKTFKKVGPDDGRFTRVQSIMTTNGYKTLMPVK